MVTQEQNPGILDFQDALVGPLTYDLVSLLRDCYIRWPAGRVLDWARQYRIALLRAGREDIPEEASFLREQLEAQGKSLSAEEEEQIRAPILEKYETEGHPFYSSARLWDDGILDPRQTRDVLGLVYSASLNQPIPDYRAPVFRM